MEQRKTVIVINGSGGVGKDTLCEFAARHYRTKNVSSITPIKEIASLCGWRGEKNDKARKFLADLKSLTVAYNDFPTKWIVEEYKRFLEGDEELMFVHIREGAEISKFVKATEGKAKTLLIRGGKRFRRNKTGYGNSADDDVEKYRYDYVFYNDHPLERTEAIFVSFLEKILNKNDNP